MRKILITGGTGFVGAHLVGLLKTLSLEISVLSSTTRNSDESAPGLRFYQVDLRKADDVRSAVRDITPDHVYHLAGISAVDRSWREPATTFEVNVLGAHNIFEAAMGLPDPPRILNVSTAQVYAPSSSPLSEISFVNPDNPYAASKAMAELLSVQYRKSASGGIITARAFNHSGPGQTTQFVLSSMARQFAEIRAGVRPPQLACGNLDVERDFTDVRDVVRAYAALMERGKPNEVYNVCSGTAIRLADVVHEFEKISGVKVSVETDPSRIRSQDVPRVVGDRSKIRRETGWTPHVPLDQTLRDLFSYWVEKTASRA